MLRIQGTMKLGVIGLHILYTQRKHTYIHTTIHIVVLRANFVIHLSLVFFSHLINPFTYSSAASLKCYTRVVKLCVVWHLDIVHYCWCISHSCTTFVSFFLTKLLIKKNKICLNKMKSCTQPTKAFCLRYLFLFLIHITNVNDGYCHEKLMWLAILFTWS